MSTRPILIVEDDPDMQEIIQHALESGGYHVVAADNGQEALRQLRDGLNPSLIVLDLMMPVMDGFEFRKAQLADPQIADIPVIVCSGHQDPKSSAERLGVAAYIEKPFDFDALLDMVHKHRAPS